MTRTTDNPDKSITDDVKPKSIGTWPVYRRLLRYALRYRFRVAVLILFSFVVAASLGAIIFTAGTAVNILFLSDAQFEERATAIEEQAESFAGGMDRFVGWSPEDLGGRVAQFTRDMRADRGRAMRILAFTLVAITLLGAAARYIQEYYAGAIGAYVTAELNREMFANVLRLSHKFFEEKTTGEVVARFTNDSFMVNRGLMNVFTRVFRQPMKIAFCVALAVSVDGLLAMFVFFVLSPIVFVLIYLGNKIRRRVRRSLNKIAAIATVITETVAGITVIKGFRMEEHERDRIDFEIKKLRRHQVKLVRADAVVGPATEILIVFAVAGLLLMGEQRISAGSLTAGELVILFGALAAVLDPMRSLARMSNMIQVSAASAERVFEYIDLEPDVLEKPDAVDIPVLGQSIRFEDVSFSYDGEHDVLSHIDLEIRRGEMVALVGFSGAGKSTVAKLIPRFYDPTGGRITIDGTDIRDATFGSLRDQVGYVTQETMLFNDTVRGNIAYGKDDFPEERIVQAARAAHADEFIEKIQGRYDAMISEGGGNLSGGQKQRIAIARAIIKDPAILILDEATSSLDSASEKAIQEAIDEFVVGRTTIVIAHRLSTVQRADRIVVLDDGRIAEQGTHAELLAHGGIYERLHRIQFAPAREAEAS